MSLTRAQIAWIERAVTAGATADEEERAWDFDTDFGRPVGRFAFGYRVALGVRFMQGKGDKASTVPASVRHARWKARKRA